jgi:putative transposase
LISADLAAPVPSPVAAGRLLLRGHLAGLADGRVFKRFLGPVRRAKWIVYCKAPFAGPEAVLRYLSRYTHRIAISNRRLVAADNGGVSFRWKDYRVAGPGRWKTMMLTAHEFIRRFLLHVLPKGFHRIRHYGLLANGNRTAAIAKARALLKCPPPPPEPEPSAAARTDEPRTLPSPCPCCGGCMHVIETFEAGTMSRHQQSPAAITIRIDTS